MAHPRRRSFVAELERQLPGAEVVWDRHGDEWDTGRRALLAADPAATHHVVVQDDALLCADFRAGAELALEAAGERPVGFYAGKPRPIAGRVAGAIKRARDTGRSWIELEGPLWGVAIAIPAAHLAPLVAWGDRHPQISDYDARIAHYFDRRIRCWYTVPSLVDHRPVAENPSLIAGRETDRRAHLFIGDRSPLEIDWGRGPTGHLPRRHTHMAQKRIADRRIYGRDRHGRTVLIAAKGGPIPEGYGDAPAPAPQAAETYTHSPATDADPRVELSDLKRADLNDRAREAGIEAPEKLQNKGAVIDAILDAEPE